jgi:hypothetical protein
MDRASGRRPRKQMPKGLANFEAMSDPAPPDPVLTGGCLCDDHTHMSVRMGAFDGDPGVRPSWRAFVAYAAPWEPIPDDGLERFAEGKAYG